MPISAMMQGTGMLEIRDLEVRYGGIQAVQGVSLSVPRGSIVTLIGANGAGRDILENPKVKGVYLGG